MRRRRLGSSVLLSALLLALTVPVASAGATRSAFVGFVFPAGYPGTGTSCEVFGGTFGDVGGVAGLSGCVLDPGTTMALGGGRTLIRDVLIVDISYAWHSLADISVSLPNEPRRTGYNVESFNANLDASMSGPVWGSWSFYSLENELMFTGQISGRLDRGQFTVRGNGIGVDAFAGQHVWVSVVPAAPGSPNMAGQFLDPTSD
jgi:hypothetical protein